MERIVADSLDELWVKAANAVLQVGFETAPRGIKTKELLGAQLVLTEPRRRIPLLPVRKFSLAYAMGEMAWYLKGDDSLAFMQRYAPSYHKYSDDGKRLHGAYGPRIFGANDDPETQTPWNAAVAILKKDPDSRQAVIPIYRPGDLGAVTKDMPCTLSLQFLIRGGVLYLITTMRSNDLWLGGLYDVFCFTVLQELMANELGIPMGKYIHNVGSFHLYERNWADAQAVIDHFDWPAHVEPKIPKADAVSSLLNQETKVWLETPAEAAYNLSQSVDWLPRATLWELAAAAWRWKIVSSAAEITEEPRRVTRELLTAALGKTFERCFH